jgi:hypothetical protein
MDAPTPCNGRPRPFFVVLLDGGAAQVAVAALDGFEFTGWRETDSPLLAREKAGGKRALPEACGGTRETWQGQQRRSWETAFRLVKERARPCRVVARLRARRAAESASVAAHGCPSAFAFR